MTQDRNDKILVVILAWLWIWNLFKDLLALLPKAVFHILLMT